MFGLFKKPTNQTTERSQTQFAYRLKYWPYRELSSTERSHLQESRRLTLSKEDVVDRCNHDRTTIMWGNRTYVLVWEHNNMPTETEWLKRASNGIVMELRTSPVIPEYAVAILSFARPQL